VSRSTLNDPAVRRRTAQTVRAALMALLVGLPIPGWAQDTDADGVGDLVDAYPCDPAVAAVAWAPAADTYGLLLFEDQWPSAGDEDFNDLVVAYNFAYRLDAQLRATSIRATLHVLAVGGDYDNGLGLHLPVPRAAVSQVRLQVGSAAPVVLTPESADGELTVRVQDDLRALLGGGAGPLNAAPERARVGSTPLTLEIDLASPTPVSAGAAPHDVFLYRSADFGHQVHRPTFGGTAAMNTQLFGRADDASGPGRHFVDARGLPFVLDLPQEAPYPAEGVALSALYPDVLTFAASGGALAADFYLSTVVTSAAYRDAAGLGPLVATAPAALAAPDRACLPVAPGVDAGSSAYLDRVYATTRWYLNNGTPFSEYVLRGEGWTLAGDHYDDTYEVVLYDEGGRDLTTGQHGVSVQCTFVTDGSCNGPCNAVPGHLFDGLSAWYGPHYSRWWELSCVFSHPVVVRSIANTAFSAAYGEGPRSLFGRRADGKLLNVPVDRNQPCYGCTPRDVVFPWGSSGTAYLTATARP
jgi:LruC domain-containing protein